MTKFIVFTTPRTGSSLLIKSLDQHPEIFCAGELFFFKGDIYHNEQRYPFLRLPVNNKINYLINYPKVFLTLNNFLDRFYSEKKNESIKAKGFKLMHFQTYYTPGIFSYLKRKDVKVILLIRKNVLRNTLSDLRARSTKVYHNEGDDAVATIPRFKVDIHELGKKMQQIEGFNKQLVESTENLNRKIIYYEDFENWDDTISDVLDYLQVSKITLQAASKKLNPDNLEEMIENFSEMSGWLTQNGYGKYLNDN
jgi:Sulfotransferase domain